MRTPNRLPSIHLPLLAAPLFAALALLACAPLRALADDAYNAGSAVGDPSLPEPWPAETPLVDVSNESWDFLFTMPEGGKYMSEEEAGMNSADDPMEYPVVWDNDGNALVFSSIMVGALDYGEEATDDLVGTTLQNENANYEASLPEVVVEPTLWEFTASSWTLTTLRSSAGDKEVSKFNAAVGNYYFSVIFVYDPAVDADLAWSQMVSIMDSFVPLSALAPADAPAEEAPAAGASQA